MDFRCKHDDCLFENVTRFLFKKDGSVKAFDFYKMKYYM